MSTLMLVNPRKRRASGGRKHRTAAQKAATARLVAFNKSRRTHSRKRRHHNPIGLAAANPRRRRRSVVHHVRHAVRRRRHNPAMSLRNPLGLIMPAVTGAAGAILVNAAVNYIPLPAALKSGQTANLTKAAFAILLGTFGRKFLGQRAVQMAEGSLTVIATQAITGMLANTGLRLGDSDGIAYYSAADIATGGVYPAPAEQSLGLAGYQAFDGMGEYQGAMGEYQYR